MKPFDFLLICSLILFHGPVFGGERWVDDSPASLVLGQPDFDTATAVASATGMSGPQGVAVDPTTGKVFVCDSGNNRVLRFASFDALMNGDAAEGVLGQANFTATVGTVSQSNLFNPRGITVDQSGTLWVSDFRNHRVVRFDSASSKANGANADGVLGAPDFDDDSPTRSQSGFGFPYGLAVDSLGNLWVGSSADRRVLMFADAANLVDGANASLVLGQENFTDADSATTEDGMITPIGIAISDSGTLFVADQANSRVLRFDSAATKANGADADAVLGQPDFVSSGIGTSATGMNLPFGIAIDPEGTLRVADPGNHRILGFTNAEELANGAAADHILGHSDYDTGTSGLSISDLDSPNAVAIDGLSRILVADSGNNRVLAFETTLFRPDMTIGPKTSRQKGNNRYNRSGAGQKETIKTFRKEVKFIALVQNDGESMETFSVGSRKTSGSRQVRVFSKTGGKKNVTSAAKLGAALTNQLAPRGIHQFELKVKPKGSARKKRSNHKVWIEATSVTDGETDRVIGFVKNLP